MTYSGIITNVHHKLPVTNVVSMNLEYAFIESKYESTNKNLFGTDFADVNYAQTSEVQGAKGFAVSWIEDTNRVMQEAAAVNKAGHTVVADCKITIDCPIPAETLELNPKLFSESEISAYRKKYEAQYLVPFHEFLEAEGLGSQHIK